MPIRKVPGGYKIDNVSGVMKTRQEAEKRLKAVKASQRSRKRK